MIPNKLPYFSRTTSSWDGDVINKNPSREHLRFWVQNCNGIKINDDSNTNHNFTQLHEYGVNYFSFTESNVNTSNAAAISKLHRIFRSRFKSGRMAITNTPDFPRSTSYQLGGVFSGCDGTLNSRFIKSEHDDLGRWHCHTLRGKQKDIKIYTVYRVHRKTDDTAGLSSAWMQQRSRLRQQNGLTNPRDDIINNLVATIRKDINSNKSVILMGDFNESIDSREQTHVKLSDLGMVNLMEERFEST